MNDWLNILAGGGSAIVVWIIGRVVISNWKRDKKIEKEWKAKEKKRQNRKVRKEINRDQKVSSSRLFLF